MANTETTAALNAGEAYRRWQRREEDADLATLAHWQDQVIAKADPECEELITALEAGWLKDAGR